MGHSVYPNAFLKMSVRLATQVLSHSVAATIRTCISTGQLKNTTAENTAEFVDFMDQLFDSLNSKQFFPNPYRCPLTARNDKVRKTLQKGIQYFQKLQKISLKDRKITRPACFPGIVQTIKGILQLFDDEYQENKIQFLFTNRLNQDILENLF